VRNPEISALLPVHAGILPGHLQRTIESVIEQTRTADEVVLVEDGPLPEVLHDAIATAGIGAVLRRVVLDANGGAGIANQAGLEAARGTWIAKVDADDISLPHRFATQMRAVTGHDVDVCGAAMLEFEESEDNVVSVRTAPETHEAIGRRMRFNSPVNHPTAFYRRAAALQVGGYPPWRYMQDYGLFSRMFAQGSRMMNLAEPLVLFRSGGEVTTRRRSTEIRVLERTLQRELRSLGMVSTPLMMANLVWRSAFRFLPSPLMAVAYRRVLSEPVLGGTSQRGPA
jgi:glycosyltransferase involved in cell wall biosynthesis